MKPSPVIDVASHTDLGADWTVAEVRRIADSLQAMAGDRVASLDMRGVERMDLCGLQLLLRLAIQHPHIRIVAPRDCFVRGVVRCAGLDTTLNLEERT